MDTMYRSQLVSMHYNFEPALYCFWKVQKAEAAYIHPNWKGENLYGYDAALLRLSIRITVPIPVLADTNFHLYPNLQFHMSMLLAGLEIVEADGKADGISRPKRCLYNGTGILTDHWQYMHCFFRFEIGAPSGNQRHRVDTFKINSILS